MCFFWLFSIYSSFMSRVVYHGDHVRIKVAACSSPLTMVCVCSGKTLFMILTKADAVQGWRGMLGPPDPEQAKEKAPDSYVPPIPRPYSSSQAICAPVCTTGTTGLPAYQTIGPTCLLVYRSTSLPVCPSARLPVCPSARLPVCPSARLPVYPSIPDDRSHQIHLY